MDLLFDHGGAVLQRPISHRKVLTPRCELHLLHVWDPRFIVLILTSTVVDYFLGIWMETASGRRKKFLLVVSLVVNLGILGFFKYYDCSLRPSDRALNGRFA